MFEKLRQTIESIIDAATPPADARDVVGKMHEAVVETRAALMGMQEQLENAERRLAKEREELADAERRGKLAEGIGDTETVEVAQRFAAKHQERVNVLSRKVEAQRAELQLAEREFAQMREQLKKAKREGGLKGDVSDRIETAWRDLESVQGDRPEVDYQYDPLRSQMDAAAKDAAAAEQLRQLKKKMGR